MSESLTLTLAPLILLVTWSVFVCSKSLVISLVSLLMLSLVLPTVFMSNLKLFWPCGLLLILMSTGLIVVFAYVVSLHSTERKSWSSSWLTLCLLWGGLGSFYFMFTPATSKIFHLMYEVTVSPSLSLLLITLLLYLVVSFIRIVYSKGGGFRKKF